MLYTPTAADMALYVQLLGGDPHTPSDLVNNAANKAQVLAVTHLFMVHGRVWTCLRPCIEAGGLRCALFCAAHCAQLTLFRSIYHT